MQEREIKKEDKKRKYLLKLIILASLMLPIFWLLKGFCYKSLYPDNVEMFNLYSVFKIYFYLIIFAIIFELIRYFTKLKSKIKNDTIKFFIDIVIFVSIFYLASQIPPLFFYGIIIVIIFFLYLQLVSNAKELFMLLLIIFSTTFLIPFFYNNYHAEYFYKEKGMKIFKEEMDVYSKLIFVEKSVTCYIHTPPSCKFIRSLSRPSFCGFGSSGGCENRHYVECVYMCPK